MEGKWAKPRAGVGGRGCDVTKAERVKASGLEAVGAPHPGRPLLGGQPSHRGARGSSAVLLEVGVAGQVRRGGGRQPVIS